MNVAIGSDHGGFEYKNIISAHLKARGITVTDFGTDSPEAVDYPVIANKVAHAVADGKSRFGILICGTGIGMSIAANKVKGIRAAVCSEHFSARYTRLHNNANILCMGARVIGFGLAEELVDLFIDTPFEGGRHQRRIDEITEIEMTGDLKNE